ncbi:hypothetical protein QUF50_02830 [Thiotrichales bacterium HSG1]|nr:hypothetical protein [Thiotrichales bacterium HSG1]
MIQNKLHRIFLLVILLLIHPVIMADDWRDLHNDLDKEFLEYVDKAKIDEATKKKHTELTERLCKIHEQGAKSNKVFEIMRYYEQFDPEPDVKLDLVLTQLWFDALKGWYIASNVLFDNLEKNWILERRYKRKGDKYFVDKLPEEHFTVSYCVSLLKKSGKKYFNIRNFKVLDKHNPIIKYASWLNKATTPFVYETIDLGDTQIVLKTLKELFPDTFPDVWLNVLMEYIDFQKEFTKIQKKLDQLLSFYKKQKNSEPKALEYLRRLKNSQLSEYKKQDGLLRYFLFSAPTLYYSLYRYCQYKEADSLIWFDDKSSMRNAAIQLSKLTPFIPYLDEDTVKEIMETQRKFKDKFGEKEYADIVTESKLLPNNWAEVFKKLTPP